MKKKDSGATISLSRAAKILGVTERTVRRMLEDGRLKGKRTETPYPPYYSTVIYESSLVKQAAKGKAKAKENTTKFTIPSVEQEEEYVEIELDWYDYAKEHSLSPAALKIHLEKELGDYNPAGRWMRKAAREGILLSEISDTFNTKNIKRAKEIILDSFPGHFIVESPRGKDVLLTPVKDKKAEYEWLNVDTSKKKFTYYVSPQENYMSIRFDDDLPGDKIRIINLTDIHVGSKAFREDMFDEAIEMLKNDPMCFAVIGGDVIEAITKVSVGDPAEQIMSINEQMVVFVKKLMPVAHKLLAMEWGNHCGGRTEKAAQVDIARTMASMLKVPYFRVRVTIDLYFRGVMRTISLAHKYGKALSPQAIVAQVFKLNSQLLFPIHCWMAGHIHTSFVHPFEATFREGGSEPKLTQIRFYITNGGSFVRYTDTYAEQEMFTQEPQDIVYFEFDDKGAYRAGSIPYNSI